MNSTTVKSQMRKRMLKSNNVIGDLDLELSQIKKQSSKNENDILSITITCTELLTLICCNNG